MYKFSLGQLFSRSMSVALTLCAMTLSHADYTEQSYSAASAPGVSAKTLGYDFLSGTINYNQSDIVGSLPYTRIYQGSVRSDIRFSINFYDKLITNAGWTDNYDNFIDFQQPGATDRLYRIRLPGELHATYFVWNSSNNTWKRMYSSSPEPAMLGPKGILTKSDLGEYSISKNAEVLTIKKYGTVYTTTATPYLSGASKYLKISTVNSPTSGKILTLTYDSALNMTKVQDNRGSSLTFTRAFKENTSATSQTANEKTVITRVTYAGASGSQSVTYNYQAAWNKNAALNDDVVYKLVNSTSTVGGIKRFNYTQLMAPWTNLFIRQQGGNCFDDEGCVNSLKVPILTEVQDRNSVAQTRVDVTQNYSYNASTGGFNTATATIRGYAPLGTSSVGDMTTRYDDLQGQVFLDSYKPNGSTTVTGSTSISIAKTMKTVDGFTYEDDSQATLSYSSPTNFAAFTVGNQAISSMVNDSYYSHLVSYTTLSGAKVDLSYDNLNRITQSKETAISTNISKITTYTYGALSDGSVNPYNIPTQVVTPYQTITNVINVKGQITSQTQTASQTGSTSKTITYAYNTNGFLTTVNGPLAGDIDKVTYTYDAYGNKASESQVINGITRTTQYLGYNSFGKPERIVYPNGLVDQFVYNADGTVQKKVHGTGGATGNIVGQTISYTYDTLKRVKTETAPDGEVTTSDYDTLGRVIKTTHPNGSMTHKTYHANGTVSAEETKNSAGALFIGSYQEIDANGQVSKVRSGNNADWYWESYTYDASGNKTQTTSRLGTIEKWTYDAFNRVTSHTDGENNTNTKSYDLQDNVISAKDAINSGSNPLEYVNGKVLKKEVNADFSTKAYSYDAADRMTQVLHNIRQCDSGNLDALGRAGSHKCVQSTTGAPLSSTYVHDYAYTYDTTRFGRLESASSVANSFGTDTSYTYDAYDRVVSKTQNVRAMTQWGGTQPNRTVSYTYSVGGKLTGVTLPSGRQVTYGYDATNTGQLINVALNGSNLINTISYNGAGQTLSWAWGNSSTYSVVYDVTKNGNIKTIINTNASNTQNYKADYGFDRDGRIVSITGLTTKDTFSYDKVNRLRTENRINLSGSTAIFGITYTYDKNGNRLSLAATGTHQQPAANVTYTYATNTNRLATITRNGLRTTPTHTTEGELRLDFSGGYDSFGQRRWSGKRNGDSTQPEYYFAYNHKRERTVRSIKDNGATWSANAIQYVYDESSHLIGEYKSDGTALVEYVWKGDVPIAAIYGQGSATKIYYIVTDAQNTPRRLIDSSNNAVVWAWDSSAFGVAPPSIETVKFNLRFPGQYYDEITKQHYNLNRYYNPEIGRYMEADPIGLEGGLNPYAYAGSNPVMNVDPSGLDFFNFNLSDNFLYQNAVTPDYNFYGLNQTPTNLPSLDLIFLTGHKVAEYGPIHTAIQYGTGSRAEWVSAGPEGFSFEGFKFLVGGITNDRPTDAPYKNIILDIVIAPTGSSNSDYFNTLKRSQENYCNCADYDLFPEISNSYNSNSYVSGLIGFTGGSTLGGMDQYVGGGKPFPFFLYSNWSKEK